MTSRRYCSVRLQALLLKPLLKDRSRIRAVQSRASIDSFEGKQRLPRCHGPCELIEGLGRVFFPASIWREMCLVGHWISDAIILRWAELSRSFTKQSVTTAEILARLLIVPVAERAVSDAKNIYNKQYKLECVWSGKTLHSDSYEVDLVIPFSLWHNNDLWNLLPADSKVNRQNGKRRRIALCKLCVNAYRYAESTLKNS